MYSRFFKNSSTDYIGWRNRFLGIDSWAPTVSVYLLWLNLYHIKYPEATNRWAYSTKRSPYECLDWQPSQFINIVGKDDRADTGRAEYYGRLRIYTVSFPLFHSSEGSFLFVKDRPYCIKCTYTKFCNNATSTISIIIMNLQKQTKITASCSVHTLHTLHQTAA